VWFSPTVQKNPQRFLPILSKYTYVTNVVRVQDYAYDDASMYARQKNEVKNAGNEAGRYGTDAAGRGIL
jgi:hypothetical protein